MSKNGDIEEGDARMKPLARALIAVSMTGMFGAAVSLPGEAEAVCSEVAVPDHVEAAKGELSLADLLTHGTCSRFQQAAAQVSLGAAPRSGSVRVLDGRDVRRWLTGLETEPRSLFTTARMKIPERVVVERAGRAKPCSAIARFVAGNASGPEAASAAQSANGLSCAAVPAIPEDAPLELARNIWNPALQRWEFTLRCARTADCVPFLVWARESKAAQTAAFDTGLRLDPEGHRITAGSRATFVVPQRLVKAGQSATLTWDQAGIRVVLPVTCLDAGGLGQLVRVRFKNAPGILRAEVVGEGMLRASI